MSYKAVKALLHTIAFSILCSCSLGSKEEIITPEEELRPEDCQVVFQNLVITQTNESSRAGIIEGNHFPEGHQVGIYAQKTTWSLNDYGNKVFESVGWSEENILETLNNAAYIALGKNKNDELVPVDNNTPEFPPVQNSGLKVYSYSPYTKDVIYTSPQIPKVEVIINENMEKTEDYLYATPQTVFPESAINVIELQYKHILSKINFQIYTKDTKFNDTDCPILTDIFIKTRYHQGGYLNLQSGIIEPIEDPEITNKNFVYSFTEKPFKITPEKIGEAIDTKANFFFIPNDNAIEQITLNIIQPGDVEPTSFDVFTYDNKQPEPKNLKAGKMYTILIEYAVRSNVNCQIEAWQETDNKHLTVTEDNLKK